MKTIWYRVNEELEKFPLEINEQYCIYRKIEQKWIAQQCASKCFYEKFHNETNYDFPIIIHLYETENSGLLSSFNIELEYVPNFFAHKIVDK